MSQCTTQNNLGMSSIHNYIELGLCVCVSQHDPDMRLFVLRQSHHGKLEGKQFPVEVGWQH